jgi:small subunit ribosomal protein S5
MKKSNFKSKKKVDKPEFDKSILDIARVTRVTKGGKQMSFRVCVVLGDRKGRVGLGLAKGKDVQIGVDKASAQAKKSMILVPVVGGTIAHSIEKKFKAARVLLHPAPAGSGIIAGGAVRVIMELAGVPNVSAKILSKTKNKVSIAKATIEALRGFKNYKNLLAQNSPKKAVKPEFKKAEVKVELKPKKKEEVKKTVKKEEVKK